MIDSGVVKTMYRAEESLKLLWDVRGDACVGGRAARRQGIRVIRVAENANVPDNATERKARRPNMRPCHLALCILVMGSLTSRVVHAQTPEDNDDEELNLHCRAKKCAIVRKRPTGYEPTRC